MSKLSVIIVNYRVKHYLDQCVHSVKKALAGLDADIWVVDNCSGDDSVECIKKWHPDIHIIENDENLGFSRANNQAIRQSSSDYVLLLNPDTVVGENVLAQCVSFLDQHPHAGALGVKMLSAEGCFARESRRGVPTPLTAFFKMSGLCSLFPKNRWFGRYYMGYLDLDKTCQIEIVSGAFMMLNRKAIEKVGLLDEDFFMYGEDIDLSYRLLKGGYKNYYLPISIIHYKGESTVKSSYRYVYVFYEAMLIFFRKHFGNYDIFLSYAIKSAIYFRGVLAYVQMQTNRALKMCRKETVVKHTYCFSMHKSAACWKEQILQLLKKKNLRGSICVYDPSKVTYAEAIREIEQQKCKSSNRKEISFIYPSRQILITSSKVYEWNNSKA